MISLTPKYYYIKLKTHKVATLDHIACTTYRGHVLVGTPGRLEDFMKKKELAASLKALVVTMELLIVNLISQVPKQATEVL